MRWRKEVLGLRKTDRRIDATCPWPAGRSERPTDRRVDNGGVEGIREVGYVGEERSGLSLFQTCAQ